ncbi:hypothetical protein B0T16DRAFT_53752 [Cercophora newfieldiana]|uniref:Uncharacterized protein n=1 Tax=Cercophora newfieldiana TaxID=92897 RepID=A0AA39YR75_9PEZI|nr:hypothetical protein B0T16DRAFT_53752 [Cercophora newfieldiana]
MLNSHSRWRIQTCAMTPKSCLLCRNEVQCRALVHVKREFCTGWPCDMKFVGKLQGQGVTVIPCLAWKLSSAGSVIAFDAPCIFTLYLYNDRRRSCDVGIRGGEVGRQGDRLLCGIRLPVDPHFRNASTTRRLKIPTADLENITGYPFCIHIDIQATGTWFLQFWRSILLSTNIHPSPFNCPSRRRRLLIVPRLCSTRRKPAGRKE